MLPVLVCSANSPSGWWTFFQWPFFGPLLVENESSDARDHCANERSMPPISLSIIYKFPPVSIPEPSQLNSSHFPLARSF